MARSSRPVHAWKFFRAGGLDQVSLETGDDLLALADLDPKLWVALSCPVKGLELDEKTLALIDTDGDGRIRVPELIAAVQWAAARLKDPADLLRGQADLPLAAIDDRLPAGQVLLGSARQILARLGRPDAATLAVDDAADTARIFSASPLNGDGVIPPEATEDPAVRTLIRDIVASGGGTADRAGSAGVTAGAIKKFFDDVHAHLRWLDSSATKQVAVLGEATGAAVAALRVVRAKVDDYFVRGALAAFDDRAAAALNRAVDDYVALAARELSVNSVEIAALPLARVEAGRPLPLLEGVNPAWAAALETLHAEVVSPLFGEEKTTLTAAEWAVLTETLAPYEAWLGDKPGGAVEALGVARLRAIAAGPEHAALSRLVAQDEALAPEFKAISEVERLARYHRDLRTLLRNFVNFADFYSRDRPATFQAGTLFLDSRSTELCLRVDGATPLAAMSKACIAYCTCTRTGATLNLAACFTQGDSDYLFVGRHGVFYDRKGRDWDAVITSIVDNPIGVQQAFWSPYKKFLRFIEEQVAKRAAVAEAEASGKLATAADKTANLDKAKPETPKKFDLAVITGIGVALGSIGTFASLVLAKFVEVPIWKLPLIFLGLMLVISLPSMVIAWIKLRQRTLGPILEASGWAVNGRVKINIPLGTALTAVAKLPPGAVRSLEDPYEDKAAARRRRRAIGLLVLLALAVVAGFIRWQRLQTGHYFWQPAPVVAPVPAAAPGATPPDAQKS